ncbi:MAG: lysophospholipase [Planctomycetaceae bacterium]|nr:lysophospholipase [Planctomycetaceae bacterium]
MGRIWRPSRDTDELAGHVMFVHGLADHCGRYEELTARLGSIGLATIAIDLHGHGESAGRRAYVQEFDDYLTDVDVLCEQADREFAGTPRFLMGHSMGATVTALWVIKNRPQLAGLILSSGAFSRGADISPILAKLSHIIVAVAPRLATVKINPELITRDIGRATAYREDPLVDHDGIRAQTGAQLLKAIDRLMLQADTIDVPTLMFHGTADQITNPAGTQLLFERLGCQDKTLKLYEGLFHETLNELERDQVYDDLLTWVMAHLPTAETER